MSVKALTCIPAELMNRCKTLADLSQTRSKSTSNISRLDSRVYLNPANDSLRQQVTILRQKVVHLQNKIKVKERQADQSLRNQYKAAVEYNNQLSLEINQLKDKVVMLSHCQQQACRARVQIQKLGQGIQKLESDRHISNQKILETRKAFQQSQAQLQAQIRLTQSLNDSIAKMALKINQLKQANLNLSESHRESSRLREHDRNQNDKLKSRIEELVQRLANQNPQKAVLLTAENQRLQVQINNLLAQRAQLQGSLQQEQLKQSKLPLLQHQLRVREQQKVMWRSSTNQLRQQLRSKQQQLDHLLGELSGYRDMQMNALRKKLAYYERRQSQLQSQVQVLNRKAIESENSLRVAHQDLHRLRADCSSFQNRVAELQKLEAARDQLKRQSIPQTREKVSKSQAEVQIDFGNRSRIRELEIRNMQLQEQAQGVGLKMRQQQERLVRATYKQQELKRQLHEFEKSSQTFRTSLSQERNEGEANFQAVKVKLQLTAERMAHAQTRKELGIVKNNFQICLLQCNNLQNRIAAREALPKASPEGPELPKLRDQLSKFASRAQEAELQLRSLHQQYKAQHGRYLKCQQSLKELEQQHGRLLKSYQDLNQQIHRHADVQAELMRRNSALQQTLIHNQRNNILQRQNQFNSQTVRTRSKSRNGQDCEMEHLITKLKLENRRLGDILMGQVKLRY